MSAEPLDVELFDDPAPTRRASEADVLRFLIGVVVVAAGFVFATVATGTVRGIERDIFEGLATLPDGLEQVFIGISQVLAIIVPVALAVVMLWQRQWAVLMTLLFGAAGSSIALNALTKALPDREVVTALERLAADEGVIAAASFPSAGYLAGSVALITIGAPWLSLRWKRAAWMWVAVVVLVRLLVASQPMLDMVLSIGIGMVAGSILLLLFGSPTTEPHAEELLLGLRSVGLQPKSIARRVGGESPSYWCRTVDGQELLIKARTPADQSADRLHRGLRSLWFRSSEVRRPFGNVQRRMEHEALALQVAAQQGVRVPALGRIGVTRRDAAFLCIERIPGSLLSDIPPRALSDELMGSIWSQVALLHAGGIAHRQLSLDNVVIDFDGEAWLTDFDAAELIATPVDMGRDVAELLVGLATIVGARDAVRSAVGEVSGTSLRNALRALQPLALTPATRRNLEGHQELLSQIRSEMEHQAGIEGVRPQRLERIRPRTLVMIVAATLAFYTLLPQFGSLDETFDAFASAEVGWIIALLVASAVTYVFATVSFLGSVTLNLPVGASLRLQVASSFASLVGPSSTGQMALSGRFLAGAGMGAGDASAAILLNTLAGLVAHVALLIAFFAWTGQSQVDGFSLPDATSLPLILAVAVTLVGVALAFRPVRRALVGRVASGFKDAASHIASVLRQPGRVALLLGGSLGISLTYIAALVFAVEAFGGDLSVAQVGAAFLGATILSTIAPTPGGLGAFEAATVAALTGFGLGSGVAISAVLTYRLATFWLPILPGWATLQYMQSAEEV